MNILIVSFPGKWVSGFIEGSFIGAGTLQINVSPLTCSSHSLTHSLSRSVSLYLSLPRVDTLSLILAFSLSLPLWNSQPISFSAFSAAVPLSLTQTHTHSMFCFVSWRPFGFFLGLYRLNRIDVKLVVILLTLGAQF